MKSIKKWTTKQFFTFLLHCKWIKKSDHNLKTLNVIFYSCFFSFILFYFAALSPVNFILYLKKWGFSATQKCFYGNAQFQRFLQGIWDLCKIKHFYRKLKKYEFHWQQHEISAAVISVSSFRILALFCDSIDSFCFCDKSSNFFHFQAMMNMFDRYCVKNTEIFARKNHRIFFKIFNWNYFIHTYYLRKISLPL